MCTILALGGDAFVPATARPAARISSSRLVMAESFSVTFVAPDGSERVLGVPDDESASGRGAEASGGWMRGEQQLASVSSCRAEEASIYSVVALTHGVCQQGGGG